MKQLQQHYTKELSDSLEKLEHNYHSKRNEAFEKLVISLCSIEINAIVHSSLIYSTGKKV